MSDEVSLAQVLASVSKENNSSGLNVVDKIKDELKRKVKLHIKSGKRINLT